MTLSKFCKASALVIGFSLTLTPVQSKIISLDIIVEELSRAIAAKKGNAICKKANIWKKAISIRSVRGKICSASVPLAGFVIATCYDDNIDEFRESRCYENAAKKLGITPAMTKNEIIDKAVAAMAKEIGKKTSPVYKLACKSASSLPGPAGKLARAQCS